MQEYTLKVQDKDSAKRLDMFLLEFAKRGKLGLSRNAIQKLILDNHVKLKGKEASLKPHYKIKLNDEFHISIITEVKVGLPLAEDIPLDIVYKDKDLAIINKPIGLVVHPAPGNYKHTLVNALLHHFKELSDINPERPGIVHRLDKDTSGLLVIAKNNESHLSLAKQFSEHTIKRKYIAIVTGRVEFNENIIEAPIGRHPVLRTNMSVGLGKNARYAKTYYRVLKREPNFSLLELEPFTGRTHQLRVHLNFIGHPILGDVKYGKNNKFTRLALHAKYIGFMHPRNEKFVEFSTDLPEVFLEFLNKA